MPDGLDGLAGEERNKVYRMLRLEVTSYTRGVLDYRCPEGVYAEWHGCAGGDSGDRARNPGEDSALCHRLGG